MHRLLLILGCCFLFQSSLNAQSAYWQQEVNYTIDVSLDDREHALNGMMKLQYVNHSPDTLRFIWFHVWPNAFKNDRTAFSDQLLENGKTSFYFSNESQRGYINRLDFRVNNARIRTEDHPQFIDVIKVVLPEPLAPGEATMITTPFHVKLPAIFSRTGFKGNAYQIAYWYPRPAVYDRNGWHAMPYLDQGEGYSEFGSFDVRITVPEYFAVAATGELVMGTYGATGSVKAPPPPVKKKHPFLMEKKPVKKPAPVGPKYKKKIPEKNLTIADDGTTINDALALAEKNAANMPVQMRTLQFKQDRVHDFAWFAHPDFIVEQDTVALPSGRIVKTNVFRLPGEKSAWNKAMPMLKKTVLRRSQLIGEYPYNVVSVVEAPIGFEGGMEYPTITSISSSGSTKELDHLIGHEAGHNWFFGVLGSNERDHPWMDEGLNTYYDRRTSDNSSDEDAFIRNRIPQDEGRLIMTILAKQRTDQPINTKAADFTWLNNAVIPYTKTALWLEQLEKKLGTPLFDSCMRAYYQQWQFKHPAPQDFRRVMEQTSGQDLSSSFSELDKKGEIDPYTGPKKLKPAFLFNMKDVDKVNYINFFPAIGYNTYDKFMAGIIVHNYFPPLQQFRYVLAPLYAFGSKQVNGVGRIGYTFFPKGVNKVEIGLGGARFSTLEGVDSNNNKIFGGYYRFTPQVRVTFNNKTPRNTIEHWLEWKTFIIGEQGFRYAHSSKDDQFHPYKGKTEQSYINQLTYNIANYRALYPYDVQFQVQQGDGFYRASATGNYFLNYADGGGLKVRAFAAKFGYIGERTSEKEFRTMRYQPKLTAVRGNEDYTYSNYFVGRNDIDGLGSQQMMMRDGGLKLRTDLFQDLQGRSDNWIASMNFSTSLPRQIFPVQLPVRLFLDVGTYSDAWKKNAATSRFLYVGGIQLSLFKDILNIYAPLVYSTEFRDNLKTVPEENKFLKKISFSIDIQRLDLRRLTKSPFSF